MELKEGDILRCIKNVDYRTVYGHEVVGPNQTYYYADKKYTIESVNINKDGDTYYYNIKVNDEYDGTVGFNIHETMEENNRKHTRYLYDYFISVKQHRKKIIDGFNKRK